MFFVVHKKNLIIFCISLFLGTLLSYFMISDSDAKLFSDDNVLTVIIDAGHGIPDGGAVGVGGTIEQEINLKIAKKVKEVLTAKGINVIMTRNDKYGLCKKSNLTIREMKIQDMKSRMKIMQNSDADLFVSIHLNSYQNSSASGLRVFYSKKFEDIKPLAEAILLRMADTTGAKSSDVSPVLRNLYLMKNPPIPSILVECGFLSNPLEEEKLKSDEYQSRLSWSIADAIEKYYALYND